MTSVTCSDEEAMIFTVDLSAEAEENGCMTKRHETRKNKEDFTHYFHI